MDENIINQFLQFQQDEMTESGVYKKLAFVEKNESNKTVLLRLSAEEESHAAILKKYTKQDVTVKKGRIRKIYLLARILGITFAIKLMENGEKKSQRVYEGLTDYPDLQQISHEEDSHEMALIKMIDEERLEYMGSVVLGLNDALVEFTGALAGFSLALNNSPLIALTGSITGISAALSMASSEYLSTKSEKTEGKHPAKAAVYTGIAYIITVVALILPFVFIKNVIIALIVMLAAALCIIALFNYYYSVARDEKFKKRFGEMAVLSFSVAAVSFLIGYLLKIFTGIDV